MKLVWDSEEWRDVVGAEDRYEVSNHGRVRSKSYTKHGRNVNGPFSFQTKPKLIAIATTADGYLAVRLRRSDGSDWSVTVHRLVAVAFLPPDHERLQVNHIDSCRTNNCVSNLEWSTASENVKHSYVSGFNSNAGERNHSSILTEEVVRKIRQMWNGGTSVINIAKEVGYKRSTVSKVVHGNNWKEVA
jgi:hypothetical protein